MIGKKKNDDYTKSNDTNKVIQNVYDLYIFYDNYAVHYYHYYYSIIIYNVIITILLLG